MPMSANEIRVVDPLLTSVVQGFKLGNLVGDALFPHVPVKTVAGKILSFGKEHFQLCDTLRAPGSATKRISFGFEGKPYALENHALEADLPREFQREADATSHVDLGNRLANLLMTRILRGLEVAQAKLALDPANYDNKHQLTLANDAKWSSDTADPKGDIEDAKEVIRKTVGIYPNVMLLSPSAYNCLKDHPTILERFKYTSSQSITTEILQTLFDIPKIVVGMDIWADEDGKFHDTWGNNAILAYVAPVPTTAEEPSFGYTYVMEGHPLVEEAYEDKTHKSMVQGVTFERAPVIAGMQAGFLFQGVKA